MQNNNTLIRTAEFVSPKHPDKICDQISDAILDEYIKHDPLSRVAIETMFGHGNVCITGEITSEYKPSNKRLNKIINSIVEVDNIYLNIHNQSHEIARGINSGGAGDQGVMIGYACNENDIHLPLEYYLAYKLNKFIYNKYPYDGKTQVTLKNRQITNIVASFQNSSNDELLQIIIKWLDKICKEIPDLSFINNTSRIMTNPAGEWSVGSDDADTGLTGRKIVIDAYGPRVPVGGGAFSGKDPSKVDRSAAYMARRIALEEMKKSGAKEVYVKLAYAIGKKYPVQASVIIDGFEFEYENKERLIPENIIKELDLLEPIYVNTANWGHFTSTEFIWNRL